MPTMNRRGTPCTCGGWNRYRYSPSAPPPAPPRALPRNAAEGHLVPKQTGSLDLREVRLCYDLALLNYGLTIGLERLECQIAGVEGHRREDEGEHQDEAEAEHHREDKGLQR
jgi:hypothetical protein